MCIYACVFVLLVACLVVIGSLFAGMCVHFNVCLVACDCLCACAFV